MSKKIKITESQLKTIMERKHSYQETNEEEVTDMDQLEDKDQEEVDVKEPKEIKESNYQDYLDTNYSSDGMDDYNAEQRDLNNADALYQIGKLFYQIGRKEESEKYRQEALVAGSFHTDADTWGPYGNEDDEMMNESIKKIKSNFKRFL